MKKSGFSKEGRRKSPELKYLSLFRKLQKIADRKDNLEAFLQSAARVIGQTFDHDRVTIFLYDAKSSTLVFLRGWTKSIIGLTPGYRQSIDSGLIGKAARLRKPVVANDVSTDPDFLRYPEVEVKSEASFPISFRSNLLGVLDLQDTTKNAFSFDEVDVLNFLTRFLGSALAERQKEEELASQLEKTRVILEGTKDGYYEVDLKGNFTYMNLALAQAWGRNRNEMMGRSYRDFLDQNSIDRIFHIFNEVYKTAEPRSGVELQVKDIKGELHIVEISVSLLRDEKAEPAGFYGIVHDITERALIEQELRQANARFYSLLEALPDVIYFKDESGRNLIVNRSVEELTGLKREEIIGKRDDEIFPENLAAQYRESDEKVFKNKKPHRFYEKTGQGSGKTRYFETIKAPVFDLQGNFAGIVGISRDITENKTLEKALIESERKFRLLADNARDVIFRYELLPEMRCAYISPAVKNLVGYAPEEYLADPELLLKVAHPDDRHIIEDLVRGKFPSEPVIYRAIARDGRLIWLEQSNAPVFDDSGKLVAVEAIVRDITRRIELERQLESSLREKEVLLREIHHRVKNNMQIISSLLNLQAAQVQHSEFTSIIKDCQNRIRSMALVHEHLYQSKNLSSINFAEYLNKLIVHLYNVHLVKQEKVELEIDVEDLYLDIGMAIPLGLLVGEIISNSFKHAFPGERKGKVRVSLKEVSPFSYRLEISDNGIGLPAGFELKESKTFGLQLISLLSDQIGVRLEVERSGGTKFVLNFEYRGESYT
jgi:PAS domain S-box-containing protein